MGCSWFNTETNKKKTSSSFGIQLRKHQLTIKTCIKYVDKKSPVMRPNLQPKIYKSPVVA